MRSCYDPLRANPSILWIDRNGLNPLEVFILPRINQRDSQDVPLRLDDRGRLTLPRDIREALHWEPGDIVYLHREDHGLHTVKGVNPFDALAEQALLEHQAGATQDIRDEAKEWGIDLEKEE